MKKLKRYCKGLWTALIGRYPHDDIEKLKVIQEVMKTDARFKSIETTVAEMAEYYLSFFSEHRHQFYFKERNSSLTVADNIQIRIKKVVRPDQDSVSAPVAIQREDSECILAGLQKQLYQNVVQDHLD